MFPYRHYSHIDNSCDLDSEDLKTNSYSFVMALRNDMICKSLDELRKMYPELTFQRKWFAKAPKGHDFIEQSGKGWFTMADWRH